jgi:transcriptional regulator with XRE-family HTH domain
LRTQRRIAGLSLRQLANATSVSNAYLSQIERGVHKPSIDILRAVARGLNVSAETILDQVGLFEDPPQAGKGERAGAETEAAILADRNLTPAQRETLLAVYRSYLSLNESSEFD